MGEGENAIHLPTDTAPSKVFNYILLQRLVDPAVSVENNNGRKTYDRQTLNTPLYIVEFRKKVAEDTDGVPHASSLGIGYVLNMHQSWCPDGFALGTLLYSTVLAPGEEQRLVVREKSQSYTLQDTDRGYRYCRRKI